ncbi:MAG: RNA polymerase factor sigma-54 [Flavobacteriales bacterium]|nr:RNA polymerase factor sigma-54 [Flavobacteriales bacterium]
MLKQSLQQKLLQKLSPQQIQLMKLLQVPTAELEQRIKEEVEINPALEEGASDDEKERDDDFSENDEYGDDDESRNDFDINDYLDDDMPSYKTQANNRGADDDDDKFMPISSGDSFQEVLISQVSLRLLNEKQKQIATYIIGNLDDSGYLRRETENIVDDLAFSLNISSTQEEVEKILAVIQELDPPGIGARTLQECLLLQLHRKEIDSLAVENAIDILHECFDEFTRKHYDKIQKKLNLDDEQLKAAIDEIIHLNPKPGNSAKDSSKGNVQAIIPDFLLNEENGKLELTLNSRNAPQLRISKDYEEMLRAYAENKNDKKNKDAVQFVRQRIDAAKWFIDAIRQRQQTLLMVMNAIMEYQKEYFLSGDETQLRPMILKDIADMVGMDISTVSRVANSKYVQTHFGTFLLKTFFSESLSTDSGEEVSTREVKKILEESIGGENKRKPLTDDELAALLKEKGYNIARRTVAKYREQLNIPVARLRKEL